MKKIISLSLVFVIMICACACSAGKSDDGNNKPAATNETPLSLLTAVWEKYLDDEKFPVAGGDFSEENANMEGPGKYSIEDAEALDAALGYPAASVDMIDDAASLTHMMNANTFTCAAYSVKDGSNPDAVVENIKTNIEARQWMCGFPEKLVIATYSDIVVVLFGNDDLITVFTDKLQSVYPDTQIACDEPIE